MVKNPPANAGDIRDSGSIPGWGRSPGEGNDHPLQYSCLENPMDRGAWRAAVPGITKSEKTEQLSTLEHTHTQEKEASRTRKSIKRANKTESGWEGGQGRLLYRGDLGAETGKVMGASHG